VPIGKGIIRTTGGDVTIAATSYMVNLALKAAKELEEEQVDVEVLDLRTIKPLDKSLVIHSIRKTGRLVVGDGGWRSFGGAAEVEAVVFEEAFEAMKAPPVRVSLPDVPAPAGRALEQAYYPKVDDMVKAVKQVLDYSWNDMYVPGVRSDTIEKD